MPTSIRPLGHAFLVACLLATNVSADEVPWSFGFARVDITPEEPLRLSGYGSRTEPFEGVDESLFVRAMVLRAGAEGKPHVLVSVDTIGFPAALTNAIHARLEKRHGLARSRFVVCCTHSHTAPHVARGLDNLFAKPLDEDERRATAAYTDRLEEAVVRAVGVALEDLSPGRLFVTTGRVDFARNRRVLENGKWTGFGENPRGPVDHSLPVLHVTDPTGRRTRGIVYGYACHCTTFGGEHNRVNGDWAGYASKQLEAEYDECVALCTIGCGADANPERDRDRALEIARSQGSKIRAEVVRLLEGRTTEVTAPPTASFGYAGLPIDRPSEEDLREELKNTRPQVRRHAEEMLDIRRRMGRLPETYPMPVQSWRFGDELSMVFLGGEVCVDYAHRIQRELARDGRTVWVNAYANDVFGYVASERMRDEGGYEVDFSMIYYMQPGRWSSGTEDVILRRIRELHDGLSLDEPRETSDALETFELPEGLEIELVVSEPLIRDPVDFAVGEDGALWVVEMGDYPRGDPDEARNDREHPWDGPPGGRVRRLVDENGDGRYDRATTFLEGLSFPTGVHPWREGVVVSAAPDILFARDTDDDGIADEREVLFTGFSEANPQHRINGFAYGLDGWLYLASGTNNGTVTCTRTGDRVDVSGRDVRIDPDSGRLEAVSGRSQFGRCRDDDGHWFGNTNSEPLFQFVIEDAELRRNPFVASPSPRVQLVDPPRAPRVFPVSRTVDRFNDLFAANRFTSACSPLVFRDETLGPDVRGAVLICEPVHNLMSRVVVERDGVAFRGQRHESERESEFLASTDNWFRPVKLATGPDGGLWIADMYRHVIEHPEWIPEPWQAKLNLRAGHDRGRIYRLHRTGARGAMPVLADADDAELLAELEHANGWRRDTAQRLLLHRASGDTDHERTLVAALSERRREMNEVGRRHAEAMLGCLAGEKYVGGRLVDFADPEWRRWIAEHDDVRVRFDAARLAGTVPVELRRPLLEALARRDSDEEWVRTAILTAAVGVSDQLLTFVAAEVPESMGRDELLRGLVATSLGENPRRAAPNVLRLVSRGDEELRDWHLGAVATCLDALARRGVTLDSLSENELKKSTAALAPVFDEARRRALDGDRPEDTRTVATALLGHSREHRSEDIDRLRAVLSPSVPLVVQLAAVERLAALDPDSLLEGFRQHGPATRAASLASLLSRRSNTPRLLDALRDGRLTTADLDAATRDALLRHRDTEIRESARALLATTADEDRGLVVANYRMKLPVSGDPARGRAVFEKRCAACHRYGGVGREIGADLSALRDKSNDALLVAVLDPNRAVEGKFTAYAVVTEDGRLHTGMIIEETATSLVLGRADGTRETLLRRDIAEMNGTGRSFMPEGLERDLTPADLADVFTFLRSKTP